MKKTVLKIVVSACVAFVLLGIVLLLPKQALSEGRITLMVIDESDTTVINDEIVFTEGDTFLGILRDEYNIKTRDDSIGTVILEINDIKTDFNNTYFAFYVNGQYSSIGVGLMKLKDGDTYSFKVTKL